MSEKQDDELRDPSFLRSLIYKGSLWQVQQAVKFLSREEIEMLFREVLKDGQAVMADEEVAARKENMKRLSTHWTLK